MDRPMTTEELFDKIQDRLKEKGKRCGWGYTCCDMVTALHRKEVPAIVLAP